MTKRILRTMSLVLLTAGMLSCFSMTAGAVPEDLFACTTSRDASNDILVDFREVQLTLPASWSRKCQITTSGSSASFYHTKTHELWKQNEGHDGGGLLFRIRYSEDSNFEDANFDFIGNTETGSYYICYPSDVQVYGDDEASTVEYLTMSEDVKWIADSAFIKTEYASSDFADADDYILPQSSTAYLAVSDLRSLTGNEVQMAINEIYARHHRKFILAEVRDYFNSKSWYDGYIEAADFDPGVLNSYEGANIDLMVSYMRDNGLTSTFGSSSGSTKSQDSSPAASAAETIDVYGTVITKGSSFFRLQQPDGNVIQFWYDADRLSEKGDPAEYLQAGVNASVTYDTETYEAISVIIW